MSAVVLAERTCSKCGETKPLSQFYARSTDHRCKDCQRAYQLQRRAAVRAAVGDAEWRKRQREITAASRARTGNARGIKYQLARSKAITKLIAAHRTEYDALLHVEKYEAGIL